MNVRTSRTVLLLLAVGCSPASPDRVETSDAPDASVVIEDASVRDSGADAGVATRTPCPVEESGRCRPVQLADVVPLVEARGLCMPGYAYPEASGAVVVYAFCLDTQILIRSRSDDLLTATAVEDVLDAVSGVSGAVVDGHPTLYFVRGAGLNVWPLDATDAVPAPITLTGGTVVPSWPQAAAAPNGAEVLIAYVESQTRAFLARGHGDTLTVTDAPTAAPPLRGILAHAGTTASGRWVLTHQSADAQWRFTSFVQIETPNGWTDAIVVQMEQDNVHDAFPIARLDEGADVYYLRAPANAPLLSAYRRFLGEDGELGPEQLVTDLDVGHVEKPQPRRLDDGRIAVTMARRITPQRYDVVLAILEGDAPHP